MPAPVLPASSPLGSNSNNQTSSAVTEAESSVLNHHNGFAQHDCRYDNLSLKRRRASPLFVKLPKLDYSQALTRNKLGLIVCSGITTGIAVGAVLVFTLPALTVPFCLIIAAGVLLTGGSVAFGVWVLISANYHLQHEQQLEKINKQFDTLKLATVDQLRAKQAELKVNLASAKIDAKALIEQANIVLQKRIQDLELEKVCEWEQTIIQKEKELNHNEPKFSQFELQKLQKSIHALDIHCWEARTIIRYSEHWLQTQLEFFVLKQIDAYIDQIMDLNSDCKLLCEKIEEFLREYRLYPVTPWVGQRLAELQQLNETALIWNQEKNHIDFVAVSQPSPDNSIASNTLETLMRVQEKMQKLLSQNKQNSQLGKVNNFIQNKLDYLDKSIDKKTAATGSKQLTQLRVAEKNPIQMDTENESIQLKATMQEIRSENQRLYLKNQRLIDKMRKADSENQQLHSDKLRLTNSLTESCRLDRKISSQSPSIKIQQFDEGSSDSTKMNLEPLFTDLTLSATT